MPSWPEVFFENYRFVQVMVARLGGPGLDADDLAQEVFLVVHRKLAGLKDPTRLRSWLYGICRRVAAHQRRRLKLQLTLASLWGLRRLEQAPDTPEDDVHRRELEQKLYEAFDRLSEKKREALILFALEEMDGKDIAQLLEIPVATVWTRLHGARQDLLRALGREGLLDICPRELVTCAR
jgi:RNA polymerase sigma-70 factor (ECF subfamily)